MNASAPSKIIIITHEFSPRRGGIATYTEEIARAARQAGHDVEVWAQALPTHTPESDWPFRLRRLSLKGTHGLRCQLSIAREFIRHRETLREAIVYLPEPGPILTLMWLQLCGALCPPRLVLTFHGSEILKFHRNPFWRPLARKLFRRAERLTTLTRYTRDLLSQRFGLPPDQVLIAPGAVRSHFSPAGSTTRPSKNDKLVVLTVGRLHPRKGQLITLRALQALPPEQRARIEYWLAGTEAKHGYDALLHQQAAQSDLTVRFLGDIPDDQLSEIYDQADIFALTSVAHRHSIEGFGLVYLEAAEHGLPVVAHDIGGVNEALEDGRTGFLISPDKPAELTAAFSRLIAEPGLRQQFGNAGRAWARRNQWSDSVNILFPSP